MLEQISYKIFVRNFLKFIFSHYTIIVLYFGAVFASNELAISNVTLQIWQGGGKAERF